MGKYFGFLLACVISVWVAILTFSFRTWLQERRSRSEK